MTDPAFDSQFFQEIYEPLHRSGGFDTHAHRAWKRGIKLPHVVAFVLESHLHYLSRCGVQHRQRLLASVQITSYNSHLGLLRSEHCRVNTEQSTRAVARPAPLWHQSKMWKSGRKPLVRLSDFPVPIAWLEADCAGGYGRRWVD